MDYKPQTDEEIEQGNLIPEGTQCQAEVISAESHIGRESGKESIRLIMRVYNGERTHELWCFLTPAYAKLWKHAVCSMVGQQEYEAGHIGPESFADKSCEVIVGVDEYNGKKKNIIVDFVKSNKTTPSDGMPF